MFSRKLTANRLCLQIVLLNSLSDLHRYVDKAQLTRELGGGLEYCHSQWIHHRTVSQHIHESLHNLPSHICLNVSVSLEAIENFAVTVKTTAQVLQRFGGDLAEMELPNDVQCTKDLLVAHTDKHTHLKVMVLTTAKKRAANSSTCLDEPRVTSPGSVE